MKHRKLAHMEKTAPDFFRMSGGYKMQVKPYSERNKAGLVRAIHDLVTFSGATVKAVTKGQMVKNNGQAQWQQNFRLRNAADITGEYRGLPLEIYVHMGCEFEARQTEGGLEVHAGCFQDFFEWWVRNDSS